MHLDINAIGRLHARCLHTLVRARAVLGKSHSIAQLRWAIAIAQRAGSSSGPGLRLLLIMIMSLMSLQLLAGDGLLRPSLGLQRGEDGSAQLLAAADPDRCSGVHFEYTLVQRHVLETG